MVFAKQLAKASVFTLYGYIKAYFVDFPPPFRAAADEGIRKAQAEKVRAWCTAERAKQKVSG